MSWVGFMRINQRKSSNQGAESTKISTLSKDWMLESAKQKYSYNFTWMGRDIIQYPQDIIAIQEIIWSVKPDLIIETGIAHGGSLIFYASMLELLGGDGKAVGIDIDIRAHNRDAIERHPMYRRINMIEGSSIDPDVVAEVARLSEDRKNPIVILDSNHTGDHVRRELDLYSGFVRHGSYLIVLDTIIDDLPDDLFPDRPWNSENNPKTAVREFLKTNDRFVIDKDIENRLLLTVAPDGYLKCVKN